MWRFYFETRKILSSQFLVTTIFSTLVHCTNMALILSRRDRPCLAGWFLGLCTHIFLGLTEVELSLWNENLIYLIEIRCAQTLTTTTYNYCMSMGWASTRGVGCPAKKILGVFLYSGFLPTDLKNCFPDFGFALVYFNPSHWNMYFLELVTYLVFAAALDEADSIPAACAAPSVNASRTKQMGNHFDRDILIEWIQKQVEWPKLHVNYTAFNCLMNQSDILNIYVRCAQCDRVELFILLTLLWGFS